MHLRLDVNVDRKLLVRFKFKIKKITTVVTFSEVRIKRGDFVTFQNKENHNLTFCHKRINKIFH